MAIKNHKTHFGAVVIQGALKPEDEKTLVSVFAWHIMDRRERTRTRFLGVCSQFDLVPAGSDLVSYAVTFQERNGENAVSFTRIS